MSALPSFPSSLSIHLRTFLDDHFKVPEDLPAAPVLETELERECCLLDRDLTQMANKFYASVRAWECRSGEAREMLYELSSPVFGNKSSPSQSQGNGGKDSTRTGRILGVELPLLVKEVRRIETVRLYAETTLHLEGLVGDLEDAAFSYIAQNSRNKITDVGCKQEKLLIAIKVMKDIEDILLNIVKQRPYWTRLLTAADSRVEKALGIFRPEALRDYRAILVSFGWPPPLTSNVEKEGSEIPNPLVIMVGDKKEKFSQIFLTLCALQHLQARRETRQNLMHPNGQLQDLVKADDIVCIDHNLWTFEEIVLPLTSRIEYHFSRWVDQPRFIFALVYKITKDFLEGVDNILQPLIDKARLVGYSAKEAWVLAMVKMLSSYLSSKIFPDLAKSYEANIASSDVIQSWLHLVDLIISFDKRMLALSCSGIQLKGNLSEFAGHSLPVMMFSIFHNHSDWLQIWAEIELKDAEEKLKSELQDEKAWTIDIKQEAEFSNEKGVMFLLSTREDYKAPSIADSVIRIAWGMIERCWALPNILTRLQFMRSSACVLLNWFFVVLQQQSQELESIAMIMEEKLLLRVVGSINAARYCESVMQEWSEDMSFIELSLAENDAKGQTKAETDTNVCFFLDEINSVIKLGTDCLENIMSALLLEFDSFSRDYIQNKEHWKLDIGELKADGGSDREVSISNAFVEALDMLKEHLRTLKMGLNSKDFADLWRSIAGGLDHFIFNSIILGNTKFSSSGVDQFKVDMGALVLVFRPFCTRPEAFFPCITDSLKLLVMHWEGFKCLIDDPCNGNRKLQDCLHSYQLFHVSPTQALKILGNRK